jgi:hypothetical protein
MPSPSCAQEKVVVEQKNIVLTEKDSTLSEKKFVLCKKKLELIKKQFVAYIAFKNFLTLTCEGLWGGCR